MPDEGDRLAAFSLAVRESSLKRFRAVPVGYENWRPSPGALSVAEIARHLVVADEWLFAKLRDPSLRGMVAKAGEDGEMARTAFEEVLTALEASGQRRAAVCAALESSDLAAVLPDDRFGGDVTVWWVIVRGNLDHETHHRGQVAAYLRLLHGQPERHGG